MTDPDFVDIFDPDPDFVDIVTMLRGADRPEPYLCAAAADEIEKLRKERDEARRIACEKEAWLRRENGSARDHAERMGWDCFKDNPCPRTQT